MKEWNIWGGSILIKRPMCDERVTTTAASRVCAFETIVIFWHKGNNLCIVVKIGKYTLQQKNVTCGAGYTRGIAFFFSKIIQKSVCKLCKRRRFTLLVLFYINICLFVKKSVKICITSEKGSLYSSSRNGHYTLPCK